MYVPCDHQPPCPSPENPLRAAAVVVCARPSQGWSLLCNGVILFEDGNVLLPDGVAVDAVEAIDHVSAA